MKKGSWRELKINMFEGVQTWRSAESTNQSGVTALIEWFGACLQTTRSCQSLSVSAGNLKPAACHHSKRPTADFTFLLSFDSRASPVRDTRSLSSRETTFSKPLMTEYQVSSLQGHRSDGLKCRRQDEPSCRRCCHRLAEDATFNARAAAAGLLRCAMKPASKRLLPTQCSWRTKFL